MAHSKYRTTPFETDKMPPGIAYIIGNEAAERFSYYGMRAILFVFMTEYLMGSSGKDVMADADARFWYHAFVMSVYFFPTLGAIISDAFLGKYGTIMSLSVVYCLGHLALAVNDHRIGLAVGLTLIAIGAGGIKPCVSAHVGDQFGTRNQFFLPKVFAWFYFSINLGAAVSQWLTPELLNDPNYGPSFAFGVPGVLMFLATIVFWIGRNKYAHVPAAGVQSVKEAFSGEGFAAMRRLISVYLCIAVFWSVYDQTGSAWVQQAKRMDLRLGREWLPSQIGAINPILILTFIPLFSYVVYPLVNRVYTLTPLRKISIGLFITVLASTMTAWIESEITGGEVVGPPSIADRDTWHVGNLIDGKSDGPGWISTKKKEATWKPEEIVIQLREHRPWTISSVQLNPAADVARFLQKHEEKPADTEESAQNCWARDVDVFVSTVRKGDWLPVGTLHLEQQPVMQSLTFEPVLAEYVKLVIQSNWGGDYVSLGEVEVLAEGTPPGDNKYAAQVWPNVAAVGYKPSIAWQLLAYVLLTAAEVMVSITGLEFSYTQAPKAVKSFIMSLFLLAVALGNGFTTGVNWFIQNPDGTSKLEGSDYFWFFTWVMLATAVAFVFIAANYRGKTYIQGEDVPEEE